MSEDAALNDIYGEAITRDNVDLCKKRLGGGTIIMGNTLDPKAELKGQTDIEHAQMKRIFLSQVSVIDVGIVDSWVGGTAHAETLLWCPIILR